jgi:hypothetical protein
MFLLCLGTIAADSRAVAAVLLVRHAKLATTVNSRRVEPAHKSHDSIQLEHSSFSDLSLRASPRMVTSVSIDGVRATKRLSINGEINCVGPLQANAQKPWREKQHTQSIVVLTTLSRAHIIKQTSQRLDHEVSSRARLACCHVPSTGGTPMLFSRQSSNAHPYTSLPHQAPHLRRVLMASDMPSDLPSDAPSEMPSDAPSDLPSDAPSDAPSVAPSL